MTGIALLYIIKNYLAYEKIKELKSVITRISKSDHNKANCDNSCYYFDRLIFHIISHLNPI